MSQSYSSQLHFSSETEKEILVTSKRCRYQVWIENEEGQISLSGPGVDESSSLDELPDLCHEDLAILVVLLFESGSWPEE